MMITLRPHSKAHCVKIAELNILRNLTDESIREEEIDIVAEHLYEARKHIVAALIALSEKPEAIH